LFHATFASLAPLARFEDDPLPFLTISNHAADHAAGVLRAYLIARWADACGRSNWNGAVTWSWDQLPELLGAVRNSSLNQLPEMARP
jgi:hypothetical protein